MRKKDDELMQRIVECFDALYKKEGRKPSTRKIGEKLGIIEEEAVHVRKVFDLYLEGCSIRQCREYLIGNHVVSKYGNLTWSPAVIQNMLTNERYCGDMLLQKSFSTDCISKKRKKNRGEMPKYLITDNHPAIISREKFRQVQMEMARRSGKQKVSSKTITQNGKYSAKYALSEILYCGECGSPYRRRTWKDRDGSLNGVWICLNRSEKGTKMCPNSVNLYEEQLQEAICRGLRNACASAEEIKELIVSAMAYHYTQQDEVLDLYAIKKQIEEYDKRFDEVIILQERTSGDKLKYEAELKKLSSQMLALKDRLKAAEEMAKVNTATNYQLERIRELFAGEDNFAEYNDKVVRILVENIRVMSDRSIIIVLKGGYTIREHVEDRPRKERNISA